MSMHLHPLRRSLLFTLLLAALATTREAEVGQTRVVEIVGLRNWTRQMIEDSVASYRPGVSLADAACAVILRDSVGFADAAVTSFAFGGDTTWTVLSVVEPEMSDRVRFRAYSRRAPAIEEWADLFGILERDRRAMNALQNPEVLLEGADSLFGRPVPESTLQLRRRLRVHDTARDWELARAAILSDSSLSNRTVAALVLSNFPERDSTFYLLAEGLRTTDSGASAAGMVLTALTRGTSRRVAWRPARDALEALIGGTNLFAYPSVLNALVATEIDPMLGRELASMNPILLLQHLGARNPSTPRIAHRFLVHIRGSDMGRDPGAWKHGLFLCEVTHAYRFRAALGSIAVIRLPDSLWRRVNTPTLLIYGADDFPRLVRDSRARILSALAASGARVDAPVFADADHLLRVPQAHGDTHFVEGFFEVQEEWIAAVTR